MAKVFPGGSSVTRAFPPSLSGGGVDAVDDAWYQEYFVDFTTQTNGSIDHDDTFPELGVRADGGTAPTWLAEEDHDGSSDDGTGTLEWVDQGLKLLPNAGTNVHDSVDVPCFSVALTSCMPSLSQNDVICIQVFCEEPVTIAANYDGYGFLIYKPEGTNLDGVTKYAALRNYRDGLNRIWSVSGRATQNVVTPDSGVATVPRMLEAVLYLNAGYATFASSTSTSLTQAPHAATSHLGHCTTSATPLAGTYSPAWDLAHDTARLGLFSLKVSSATTFYNYVSAVRILRLGGRAGGAD